MDASRLLGEFYRRLRSSVEGLEGLLVECSRWDVCDVADPMVVVSVSSSGFDDAYISIPPIVGLDGLLSLVEFFSSRIPLKGFKCGNGEVNLTVEVSHIEGLVDLLSGLSKRLEAVAGEKVYLDLYGILGGEEGVIWDLGVYLCPDEESSDIEDIIALSMKLHDLGLNSAAYQIDAKILDRDRESKVACPGVIIRYPPGN